ncbi:MAG: diguanylate cyclase domain-containing protein [Janthinobacterium lividum]
MAGPEGNSKKARPARAMKPPGPRGEAARLRIALSQLKRDIAEAESILTGLQSVGHLREANEYLLIAALKAQADLDAAARMIDEVSKTHHVDALTGLANRHVFDDCLTRASTAARSGGRQLAILFVDLNGFKQINDQGGHSAGDRALEQAARRLVAFTRPTDMVARYGGDEFLVLLNDISKEDAALAADRIVQSLNFPLRVGDDELWLAASVGISLYPDDGDDVQSLIGRADAAMYRAKRLGQGKGGYAFHVEGELAVDARGAGAEPLMKRASLFAGHVPPAAHYVDLQEANEQLVIAAIGEQEHRAAAEQALQRQYESVAVIAHELRNPLSPILAAAQSLSRARAPDISAPRVQAIIERQVARMSRLVNDLLDMSRLTTGHFKLERQRLDLREVVETAVENCQHLMQARSQMLTVCRFEAVVEIDGDAARLAQALSNLMENASKYTPEGGTITLQVAVDGPSGVITLSDTGIGITAEALPHVFEPFLQDTHAVAFNNVGLGIGLTVVRELVIAHGGTITAQSAGRGLGSRFTMTLPLAG